MRKQEEPRSKESREREKGHRKRQKPVTRLHYRPIDPSGHQQNWSRLYLKELQQGAGGDGLNLSRRRQNCINCINGRWVNIMIQGGGPDHGKRREINEAGQITQYKNESG
ncbi:predicted protein [Histoplasma capsulatum H143]|uniref:Uncharacterized protein n=1 Tax=Ajellomyces capsulatus (strain H143) TaxID=544712 RepID=C6HQE8_AJECH|nr:predicted protein [Histoplasma capsulatum H143]